MKVAIAAMLLISGLVLPAPAFAAEVSDGVDAYFAAHPDLSLCASYKAAPSDDLRTQLVDRKLLTDKDLRLLARRRGDKGMTECGLLAAEGRPLMISERGDHRFQRRHPKLPVPESYDVIYELGGAGGGIIAWVIVEHGIVASTQAAPP